VLIHGLLGAGLAVTFMALFPQIKFKPQMRSLTLVSDGISTTIRGETKTFPWSDVAKLEVDGGFFIVTFKSLNAFVIPPTAFKSAAEREELYAECRTWWLAGRGSPAV
jgi:hypothetical protein